MRGTAVANSKLGQKVGAAIAETGKGKRGRGPLSSVTSLVHPQTNKPLRVKHHYVDSERVLACDIRLVSVCILTSSFTCSLSPWPRLRANVSYRRANVCRPHRSIRHGTRP